MSYLEERKQILERILKTTCQLVQKRGLYPEIISVLIQSNLEFISDGRFGSCGLSLLMSLDAMFEFEKLTDQAKAELDGCLRKVAFGHVTDQNGNESEEHEIVISVRLELDDAGDDWRSTLGQKDFMATPKAVQFLP
jgi:hypothetical protein